MDSSSLPQTDVVDVLAGQASRLHRGQRQRLIERLRTQEQQIARQETEAFDATVGHAHFGKAVEVNTASATPPSDGGEITLETIDELMRYQPWTRAQQEAADQAREALTMAARVLLRTCPAGRFRSVALRAVLEARMNANASISFRGRF